jgi:hypothetical protein
VPALSTIADRVNAVRGNRWARRFTSIGLPLVAAVVAAVSWTQLPGARLEPVMVGLLCWTVGNHLVVPMRWRMVSTAGQRWSWHVRVYAEGELFGFLTPQHAGADLWRISRLRKLGLPRNRAIADVAADRLSGAFAICLLVAIGGGRLPAAVRLLALGILAVALGVAGLLRRPIGRRLSTLHWPGLRQFGTAAAFSVGYQLGYLGLALGVIAAVGQSADPVAVAGLLGAAQLASVLPLPGIHGAGPKEGALAAGLVALGLPLTAAISAVALTGALMWVPAVLGGGVSLAIPRLRRGAAVPA